MDVVDNMDMVVSCRNTKHLTSEKVNAKINDYGVLSRCVIHKYNVSRNCFTRPAPTFLNRGLRFRAIPSFYTSVSLVILTITIRRCE